MLLISESFTKNALISFSLQQTIDECFLFDSLQDQVSLAFFDALLILRAFNEPTRRLSIPIYLFFWCKSSIQKLQYWQPSVDGKNVS